MEFMWKEQANGGRFVDARKVHPDLIIDGGFWHVDKRLHGDANYTGSAKISLEAAVASTRLMTIYAQGSPLATEAHQRWNLYVLMHGLRPQQHPFDISSYGKKIGEARLDDDRQSGKIICLDADFQHLANHLHALRHGDFKLFWRIEGDLARAVPMAKDIEFRSMWKD